jgi:hypothetical protein
MRYLVAPTHFDLLGTHQTTTTQDPVRVSPDIDDVMLVDERSRTGGVAERAKAETHAHPGEVVHFMNVAIAHFTLPDGTAIEKSIAAIEVLSN